MVCVDYARPGQVWIGLIRSGQVWLLVEVSSDQVYHDQGSLPHQHQRPPPKTAREGKQTKKQRVASMDEWNTVQLMTTTKTQKYLRKIHSSYQRLKDGMEGSISQRKG